MSILNKNDLFLLEEIVKRNFAAKYKDSVLGILWSFIKPLLIVIMLTIIFSTLFSRNIENYPVYLISGKCIYDFFAASTGAATISLKGSQNILKTRATKKYLFVLGVIISEFLNFIIGFVLLIGVMIVTNAPFYFSTTIYAIIPVCSTIMMITGISLMLSIFCVYYTDIQHLWSVIIMALMYMSALFFPMEIIPEPYYSYMVLNPVYWAIDQFRHFVIWGEIPDILNIINLFLLSLIILILGIIVFKKYEQKITLKF